MEDKKVLLSVRDLHVKFKVRGRTLTAIRGISMDLYENESVAIVGESGSGKSVFTKTFAGMLDQNGYISQGKLYFNDPEVSAMKVKKNSYYVNHILKKLNEYSKLETGKETYKKILALKKEMREKSVLSDAQKEKFQKTSADLKFKRTEAFNKRLTVDKRKERELYNQLTAEISKYGDMQKQLEADKDAAIKAHKAALKADTEFLTRYNSEMEKLQAQYKAETVGELSQDVIKRNEEIAREIYISIARYKLKQRVRLMNKLLDSMKEAMQLGRDLNDDETRTSIFEQHLCRARFDSEDDDYLYGTLILNLARINNPKDWTKICGKRIATVFQDPMTSLNPIITIGKQITSIIIKHQGCSEIEARRRALTLMKKVGIPEAEKRFDDYPFQYSGGMRQRIVIAIALSCQPKILICDEPTTALDVTIQAQILKLIKDLQKEFKYTIVFITHDLGVVANVADRVAVLYAGQVVEMGTAEEVFYDPRHPYTWALLSSLPQLAQRNTKLYSISGTPPSLYNTIVGDAFAPRNPYCLKIDTLKEPPMFKITETHCAKTWLLDPRAPEVKKPEAIENIHEKLIAAFNI